LTHEEAVTFRAWMLAPELGVNPSRHRGQKWMPRLAAARNTRKRVAAA
jgi:hypothetical protein